MSDLSETIEEDRRQRSKGTSRDTQKAKRTKKRGPSKPGGIIQACGCRWMYSGGAWRHVTPCRADYLQLRPLDDAEFAALGAR